MPGQAESGSGKRPPRPRAPTRWPQPGGERRGDGDARAGRMATAGAPVKERDQKGPSVANGAGEGEAESARAMASLNLLRALESLDPSRLHITYCHEKKLAAT